MRSQKWSIIVLLGLAAAALGQSAAQMPQSSATGSVPAEHVELLKAVFGRAGMQTGAADRADVQAALLASVPWSVRTACRDMVGQWGEDARRSERISIHLLNRERTLQRAEVLFAVRCGSSRENYAQFYDDRLAVLTIEGETGRLKMLPFEPACAGCSELYRIERGGVLLVEGKPYSGRMVEVRAEWSNGNPALGVVEHLRGTRLYLVVMPEAKVVLAADLARQTRSHDDESGDTESRCSAEIKYITDAVNRVTEIEISAACPQDPNAPLPLRYRWNPANRTFDPLPE